MTKARVLVVEDDPGLRQLMLSIASETCLAEAVADPETAIARASRARFDVLVTDVNLPRMSGIDLMAWLRRFNPRMAAIVVSGDASVDLAVAAMKRGAVDFLVKPFNPEQLEMQLAFAAERSAARRRVGDLSGARPEVVTASPLMRTIVEQVDAIAPFNASVLITGETGTGKELIARRLHENSRRLNGPFVALNCAAVPEQLLEDELFGHVRGAFTGAEVARVGRFEQANGGSLFFDEVAELTSPLQSKLLRVLQEREFERLGSTESTKVDVRIIAATSADLERRMAQGLFRADLFYRLNVFHVRLPPLRERPDDIPPIAEAVLNQFCAEAGMPAKRLLPQTMAAILAYDWPGNARQLRNAMERAAVITGDETNIRPADLPDETLQRRVPPVFHPPECEARAARTDSSRFEHVGYEPGMPFEEVLRGFERHLLLDALERSGGNKVRAAQILGIKRTTFMARLRRAQTAED